MGVVTDMGFVDGDWTTDWNARHEAMAFVGPDSWSFEYRLPFGQPGFARPETGSLWGFNAARVYRATEYAQWVRTFFNAHSPNDFGILRFN